MGRKKTIKTRYTEKELLVFEKIIDKKLGDATEQLEFYMDQMKARAESSDAKVRGLDDGNGTAEAERISMNASRLKKHISHLQNAKIRIKNKVYGVCRDTGKLISKDRLKAVPHATLSIDAKLK